MSLVIGFETSTRYVPPLPADAWQLSPSGEESRPLDDPLTMPGIEGEGAP